MGTFKTMIERQKQKIEEEEERLRKIRDQAPTKPQFGVRNFYDASDPLNLTPMSTLYKNKWETDEQYDQRLQKARQESIAQSEEKLRKNKEELNKVQAVANTNYVKNLSTNIKNGTNTPYETYEKEAVSNLANERQKIETGYRPDGTYYESYTKDLVNPFLHDVQAQQDMEDTLQIREQLNKTAGLRDLYSALYDEDTFDSKFLNEHQDLKETLANSESLADLYNHWDELDAPTRKEASLVAYLENNYRQELDYLIHTYPELHDLYNGNSDDLQTLAALILKMSGGNNSIKQAESDRIADKFEFSGLKGAFDYLKTRGAENIEEGLNQRFSIQGLWNEAGSLWSGASAWALGAVGTLVSEGASSLLGWAYQSATSSAEEKDFDVENRVADFFEKKVQAEYDLLKQSNDPESIKRKEYLSDLFYEASSDKQEGSVAFRANVGTYLTELEPDEELMLALQYEAQAEMFGIQAAQQQVRDFWQDRVATRQTWSDAASNVVGQFATSGAADLLSFAAVVENVAEKGTWQEGYIDNLVRNNELMQRAYNIMETGCFDEAEQAKYKEIGVNKYAALRTREQEASILTWDDMQEAIGQYGFTVASTIISMGGSALFKGGSWAVTRSALSSSKATNWLGRAFTFADSKLAKMESYFIANKRVRDAYRQLLKSGTAARTSTEGLELMNKLKARGLYRSNLVMDGAIGTAEGGLEAIGTYETYKEEMLKDTEKYMQQEIEEAIAAIQAEGGVDVEERIQRKIEEIQAKDSDIVRQIEDNAADAAALNFLSNAAINGFLAVGMKELTLSKDGRLAARQFRGKNKTLNDYIKIAKVEGKDAFIATVKDEYLKKGGFANIAWKTIKKAAENIGGEALEEFSQGVSDAVSRAMLENDLRNYVNTVYHGGGIDAYTMDLGNMVKQGLNTLVDNAASRETLFSAYMGGLSSMIGGVNVFHGISNARKRIGKYFNDITTGKLSEEGFWEKVKEFGKASGDIATGFAQSAFTEGYREVQREKETAQALADSVNEWFNNNNNKELLTHMGGALGFKHSMEQHLANGELFEANNDKLGLAIENAFMLEVLAETEVGRAYISSMYENSSILQNAQFDDNGRLVTNIDQIDSDTVERTRQLLQQKQKEPVTQQQVTEYLTARIGAAQSLISSFRNKEGQNTRSLNMSDQEVAGRITKNLDEFTELRQEIIKARQQLAFILHDDNIDPMTEKVLVHAMLTQKDARQRTKNLKERMTKALNDENLTEEQKSALAVKTSMPPRLLELVIEYGSLDKARKALTALDTEANTALENSKDKHFSKEERKTYKALYTRLNEQKKYLSKEISDITEDLNEEGERELSTKVFNEGDMLNMSDEQLSTILNQKKNYSKAQQAIIDNFISIVQQGLNQSEKEDATRTAEEVENDFKDIVRLKTKTTLYDRYLKDLLGQTDSLNKEISSARNKKRKDILSYLYKDDLKLKEGETYRDVVSRIDKKIQLLQEQGKLQDAEILKTLIDKDPVVRQIRSNFNSLHRMMVDTFYSARNDPNYYKGICGLRTLVDQGISMETIKRWFSGKEDVEKLKKALRRKTNLLGEGGYLFNYFVGKEGKEPIDLDDEQEMNNVISAMNKLVNMAIAVDQQKARKQQPGKTDDPNKGAQAHDEPVKTSDAGNSVESFQFSVRSLANLDPSSLKFQILKEQYGLNDNLREFNQLDSNNRGEKLRLVLCNIPNIGPIILLAREGNDKNARGAFAANGNYYRAIGYIELDNTNKSQTLQEQLDSLKTEGDILVLSDYDINISKIPEVKTVNPEIQLEDDSKYPTIKSQLDSKQEKERAEVKEIVVNAILGGHWETKENKEEQVKITTFRDGNTHPVVLENPNADDSIPEDDVNNFWNIEVSEAPESSNTLDVLFREAEKDSNGQLTENSLSALTRILSGSLFFRAIYKQWVTNPITPDTDSKWIFKNYVENFIYFGPRRTFSVEIIASEKKLIITPNVKNAQKIVIDLPTVGDPKTIEKAATKMLYAIWQNQKESGTMSLKYARPEIPTCSSNAEAVVRAPLAQSVEDLIELGLLRGNAAYIVDRGNVSGSFIMDNPFFKSKKPDKSQDPTNADDGSPIDPEDPPVKPKEIDLSEEAIEQRKKRAKTIIDKLIEKAKSFKLPFKDANFYDSEGKQSARVTSVEYSTNRDLNKPTFTDQQKVKGKIASAHGTFVDTVIRNFFEIAYSDALPSGWDTQGLQQKAQWMLDKIKQSEDFKNDDGSHSFPLGYEEQFKMVEFVGNLFQIKQLMDDKGWTVYPKDIKAFGQLRVGDTKALNVAGTLDLLVMDDKGLFHIIDMKTKFNDAFYENGVAVSKDAWEVQVATYQQLLQQQYPGMEFGENYIFPIKVSYNEPYISSEEVQVSENGMEVSSKHGTVGRAIGIPEFQATCSKNDDVKIEDFLIELQGIPHPIKLVESKLTQEQRDALVDIGAKPAIQAPSVPPPPAAGTGTPPPPNTSRIEEEEEAEEENTIPTQQEVEEEQDLLASQGNDDDFSERSGESAKYTDFMNTRIRPFTSVKVTTVRKMVHRLKKLIAGRAGFRSLVIKDLANTFCQGSIEKLKSIIGNTSYRNAELIVAKLAEYYRQQISKKEEMLQTVETNHVVSSLLKQLMEGQINEDSFINSLTERGIQAHLIAPYIGWKSAENPEAYAKQVLENLEKSKDYSEEVFSQQLAAVQEVYTDMQTKLDFLTSPNAADLLRQRAFSIERAVFEKAVEEKTPDPNGSIEKLRTEKEGTFGAIQLLQDIISRTPNNQVKALAKVLLRNIRFNGLSILVTTDSNLLPVIEGVTDGKSITLNTTTLQNYATTERVLLHEIIHCVVQETPEAQELLEELRQQAIEALSQATGKTTEEIESSEYGFKNTEEFIAEFFTNYAFQARLKQLSLQDNAGKSIFNRIIDAIVSFFRGRSREKDLFDKIENTMEQILQSRNLPETIRSKKTITIDTSKYNYDNLSEETKENIKAKGGTAKQFNAMSRAEQLYVIRCCSF